MPGGGESVINTRIFYSETAPPGTVVVGAGVVGLGIAWRLAQAGCSVTVYDKGQAGRGASWAAAGMLAAAVETEPGEEPLLPLALESQRLWPDFASELEAASGISVEYRGEGTMVVALNRDDAATLRHSLRIPERVLGLDLHWLTASQALRARAASEARDRRRRVEPCAIIRSRTGCSVRALGAAARKAGVELVEHCPVRGDHDRERSRHRYRDRARRGTGPTSSCSRPARGRARSAASRPLIARRCGRSRVR